MSHEPCMLCAIYCLYLLIGGLIFMNLEYNTIETSTAFEAHEWTSLKEILASSDGSPSTEATKTLLRWLIERCPHLSHEAVVLNVTTGNQSDVSYHIEEKCGNLSNEVNITNYDYPWGYIDALYFSMTVVTTIGYGHIAPTTTNGRIACIIYAVIGIPLTMILLTWTSDFFGEMLFLLFQAKLDKEKQSSKVFIALGTTFYIFVGFLVFIFLPPIIFMHIEHWTYFEGVYYSFITLTTIGFGDFVTGKSIEGPLLYVYQIAVIIWIMTGLGYWVMIANFITRAIRSKKMQSFAKKATDIRKLMNQVSLAQESSFLTQHSKVSLNFLMQLCSTLAIPEMSHQDKISTGSTSSPITPPTLLGISSLFGHSGFGNLMTSISPQISKVGQLNFQGGRNTPDSNSEDIGTSQSLVSIENEDAIVYLKNILSASQQELSTNPNPSTESISAKENSVKINFDPKAPEPVEPNTELSKEISGKMSARSSINHRNSTPVHTCDELLNKADR